MKNKFEKKNNNDSNNNKNMMNEHAQHLIEWVTTGYIVPI